MAYDSKGNKTDEVLKDEEVFIFSKDDCGQCDNTMRVLDRAGIPYSYIKLSEPGKEHLIEELRSEGYGQLPVVKTKSAGDWSGLRPDKLGELKANFAAGLKGAA